MKTQTLTSAMTMMATIITSFFDRVSAAPVSAPAPAPAPAPSIGKLPSIADIEIEARDAHLRLPDVQLAPRDASADALAEAMPVQGDAGDWIVRARRAEVEELERRDSDHGTGVTYCVVM